MNNKNIKLLDPKYVKVGNKEYPVKLTFRAMIDYESITGKSVATATGTKEVTTLFYCAVKAGCKSINQEFKLDYEQFLDEIDNYPDSLMKFYEAIAEGDSSEKK